MSTPQERKTYGCLRCGISVREWRSLCRDCLVFAQAHSETHLWCEPKAERRKVMKYRNQYGKIPDHMKSPSKQAHQKAHNARTEERRRAERQASKG